MWELTRDFRENNLGQNLGKFLSVTQFYRVLRDVEPRVELIAYYSSVTISPYQEEL